MARGSRTSGLRVVIGRGTLLGSSHERNPTEDIPAALVSHIVQSVGGRAALATCLDGKSLPANEESQLPATVLLPLPSSLQISACPTTLETPQPPSTWTESFGPESRTCGDSSPHVRHGAVAKSQAILFTLTRYRNWRNLALTRQCQR
jgi:hypothetical protein